ncbi:MAG: serine hydrolase domain-containing protein [Candidatus Saccharicenans sp.]
MAQVNWTRYRFQYKSFVVALLLSLMLFPHHIGQAISKTSLNIQEKSRSQVKSELQFPASDVGKKVEIFWRSFSAGDKIALENFFKQVMSGEKLREMSARERAERLLGLRQEMGGDVKALKIIASGPDEVSIIFSNSKDNLFRFALAFEKHTGGALQLKRLTVNEAGPEDLAPPLPAMSLDQALQNIQEEIEKAAQEDRFSGVVLIAKNFQPIFFKAYGLASKEFAVPNQLNTRFNLGSINKIFTKIAIGQLAEKGVLSLNDKLGKFLPDYPNLEARNKVTIRHLVNMNSGIGDFFGPEFEATPKDLLRNNRDYLKLFAAKPLAFEPGTKQMYSNGGYVVLGEIINAASGMDYYDYIMKFIFEPAGMNDSNWFEADAVVPNVAEGYTKRTEDTAWHKNIYTRPARGSAAGGGYATAEDLLRFARALYECRLLSEPWTNWVFTGLEPEETAQGKKIAENSGDLNENIKGRPELDSSTGNNNENTKALQEYNKPKIYAFLNQTQTRDTRADFSSLSLPEIPLPDLPKNYLKTECALNSSSEENLKGPSFSLSKIDRQASQSEINSPNRTIDRTRWNLGLAGGAPGINATLEFEGQIGFTIIVLSNYDPPAAGQIGRMVRRYLEAVKR